MDYKLVVVVWRDAHEVYPGWGDPSEIDKDPCEVRTSGWLIPDAKPGHLVVAQSVDRSGHVDNGIAIPEAMVVAVEEIKRKKR